MAEKVKTKNNLLVSLNNIPEARIKLREKSGIYLYYFNKKCIYVGASKNLSVRALRIFGKNVEKVIGYEISSIIKKQGTKNLIIKIFFYPIKKLMEKEIIYIRKHKPFYQFNRPHVVYSGNRKLGKWNT